MDISSIMEQDFTKNEAAILQEILRLYKNDTATTEKTAFDKIINIRTLGFNLRKMLGIKTKNGQVYFWGKVLDLSKDSLSRKLSKLGGLCFDGVDIDLTILETNPKALTCSEDVIIATLSKIYSHGINPIKLINKCPFLISKSYDFFYPRIKMFSALFSNEDIETKPNIFIPSLRTSTNRMKYLILHGQDIQIQDLASKNREFYRKYKTNAKTLEGLTNNADLNTSLITLLTSLDLNISDETIILSLYSYVNKSLKENSPIQSDELEEEVVSSANTFLSIIREFQLEESDQSNQLTLD